MLIEPCVDSHHAIDPYGVRVPTHADASAASHNLTAYKRTRYTDACG